VIVISVVIAVLIATVVVVPYFVSVPVCLVAIAVSISIPSYLPAAVPPPIVSVVVVSTPVVCVMVVPYAIAETRVISEARLVLASPFPIFPLALAVQPVVFDIVIPALSQPLPVVRVVPVIARAAVIGVVAPRPVFRAAGGYDGPYSQS